MTEKNHKKSLAICIVIAVILIGASYYVGYNSGKASITSQFAGGGAGFRGAGGTRGAGGAAGAGIVSGSVLSKDDTSITVQGRDGSSKIILYAPSTTVMKSTSGTSDDITVGEQVTVQGKTNSDGSVTAASIQIRPAAPSTTQAPMIPAQQ